MKVFALLGALLAFACAPLPPEPAEPASSAPPAIADTPAACATQGGEWRPVCMMGKPACVITFTDGGKACSDGSECQSKRCVTENTAQPDKPAKGVCARTSDPCGCMQFVEKGVAGHPLCVD